MLSFNDVVAQAQKDNAENPVVPHDYPPYPLEQIIEIDEGGKVTEVAEVQFYIDKVTELQANRHPEDIPLDDKYWEALNDLRQFHAGNR